MHGGSAKQVKAKAAERIKEARDLALEKFTESLVGGVVDARTQLDASVKLTELSETLAGRVARREEQVHSGTEDLIIYREHIVEELTAYFAARDCAGAGGGGDVGSERVGAEGPAPAEPATPAS